MARAVLKPGEKWEDAREKLRTCGIILTRHRHKKGGFVCYANKELRASLKHFLAQQDT